MANKNLKIWNQVKAVPLEAQRRIKGGRLNGMTDINPQWRLAVITELFGPIGIGWYYKIERQWIEEQGDLACAFTNIELFVKHDGEWSQPIVGTGGSMLSAKEKAGVYVSDECFKMSLTDALSVAFKQLGVGAEIYSGNFDFTSKYEPEFISEDQADEIDKLVTETGADLDKFLKYMNAEELISIPSVDYRKAIAALKQKGQC